jgi:hypothetical protein
MRAWIRSLLLCAVATTATAGSLGCAEERDPINRVQPNALAKSFFVGSDLRAITDDPEFYMRGTVVDVGYGAAQDGLFTSTYAQPVSRIKWEITEGYLNARLAYERIEGTDGKGDPIDGLKPKAENDGQIIASYRISNHFDIRRAYNSTTGEESNVVEENSSDRAWYEREYFRVDWSQNLISSAYDFDTLAQVGLYGGVKYEGLAYYVSDSGHPDAPLFDAEKGYFDITNKAYAVPQMIDLSSLGWGIDAFPACMLDGEFAGGTAPSGNCNPVELKIRMSFKKVVDNDYEPLDYDGYRFQAFGIFNYASQRYGYERNYGLIDSKWYRFAARYNIWERSHYYAGPKKMNDPITCATEATTVTPTGDPTSDPNRDADGNGTSDECEAAGAGSRCDVFSQKCTLPYRQRKHVTIPWYLAGDHRRGHLRSGQLGRDRVGPRHEEQRPGLAPGRVPQDRGPGLRDAVPDVDRPAGRHRRGGSDRHRARQVPARARLRRRLLRRRREGRGPEGRRRARRRSLRPRHRRDREPRAGDRALPQPRGQGRPPGLRHRRARRAPR